MWSEKAISENLKKKSWTGLQERRGWGLVARRFFVICSYLSMNATEWRSEMGKKLFVIVMTVFVIVSLAAVGAAADGIDKNKKMIKLSGFDSVTGKYGDYGTGKKRGQGGG